MKNLIQGKALTKLIINPHNFEILFTQMRIIIAVVIALAILNVYAQREENMAEIAEIPQSQLKALQQATKFKKSLSEQQINSLDKNGGFFNSLFGNDKDQSENKINFLRGQNDQDSQDGQNLDDQLNKIKQFMDILPYEALLPRRRQPLGFLNQIMKGKQEQSESSDNPLKELEQLLSSRKRNKGKKIHWQNPDFKEGKRDSPFMKIFGPKSKGKHRVEIKEEEIQMLLEESMPSLKGGNILKLSYVPHRKGIYLNIEYETAKEQVYTIKAKYLRKTHELEIINLTEINVLRKVEDDEESSEKVEITVSKQQTQKPIFQKEKIEPVKEPMEDSRIGQKVLKVEQKANKIVQKIEKTDEKVEVIKPKEQKVEVSKPKVETLESTLQKLEDEQSEQQLADSITQEQSKQDSNFKEQFKERVNSQLRKQSKEANAIESN